MQQVTQPTLELPPNRALFKRGSFYDCFYQLLSGSLLVTIAHTSVEVSTPLIIGDYQIMEKVDYRITSIKAVSRCSLKVIPLAEYSKFSTYYDEIKGGFSKFDFKSRTLQYWLKKTFEPQVVKRCEQTNSEQSIGIVLQGQFKIDRHIPIVRMRNKRFQLLRKFEICQLGYGEIFEDVVVCQSTQGTVGLCRPVYAKQLLKCFEEFGKVVELTHLKGQVHTSMEREIFKNCRKKPSLYQHMVPLPLQNQIKEEDPEPQLGQKKATPKLASVSMDVFRLTNNISSFLHLQWKRGLSLSVKRKDSPSPQLTHKRNFTKLKKNASQLQELMMFEQSPRKSLLKQQIKVHLLEKARRPLPFIKSLRIKTEPDQSAFFKVGPNIK